MAEVMHTYPCSNRIKEGMHTPIPARCARVRRFFSRMAWMESITMPQKAGPSASVGVGC